MQSQQGYLYCISICPLFNFLNIYCYEKKKLISISYFKDTYVEKNNIIIMMIYILYNLLTLYYFLT